MDECYIECLKEKALEIVGLCTPERHLRATGVIPRDSSSQRRIGPGLGGLHGSRGQRTPSDNGPVGQRPEPDQK